ncbi:hypothetical protein [Paralysiella testudinis]|uniref:Uncharacterized protein n=1 Tax=Paralysiella testudinis TaxID=2809020 RepID=A0A892ZM08_9NEIS|nr:hypothetical protein [Paralysiella testudinis]QRQ83418.1 hypothetical protein JQU52_01095 [Paralysiella testudinis]
MTLKVYIAQTPLILETPKGTQYRVEAGEAVELTPEQYSQVAAHVTAEAAPPDAAAMVPAPEPEADPEPAPAAAKPGNKSAAKG